MTPPRRMQSPTERDLESWEARKEREATPEFVEEDCTGRVDITADEMRRIRQRRPTPERLAKLEARQDESDKRDKERDEKIDKIGSKVDGIGGQLTSLSQFLGMKTAEDGKTQRAKITTNGKVLRAIVTAAIAALVTILTLVLK